MADRAGAFSDPDLQKRIGSAVVMALVAGFTAWWGGWPFVLVWSAVAIIAYFEWTTITSHSPNRLLWLIVGLVYILPIALGPIILRQDAAYGLIAIIYLFALVWGTDVMAYFCGRGFGGPKLWPRISPKKTWSGFIGGTLIGTALAVGLVRLFGIPASTGLIIVSYCLAVASQGGDLLESAIKRHFGVKDSSNLIPGHGGVLDRLDGFLVAAGLAALIGVVRAGGVSHAATGLLVW